METSSAGRRRSVTTPPILARDSFGSAWPDGLDERPKAVPEPEIVKWLEHAALGTCKGTIGMRVTVQDRYILFALGAATGSAVGLIVGALISFWLGDEALDGLTRAIRRLLGRDRQPNFELFLQ